MSSASQNAYFLKCARVRKEELDRRQQCLDNFERTGKFVDNDGYDLDGFNDKGLNRFGHDQHGVGPDGEFRGFCEQAFHHERSRQDQRISHYQFIQDNIGNPDVFDEDGFNYLGFDRDGFDRDGFDLFGFNRRGYNRDGFNRDGHYKAKFDRSRR